MKRINNLILALAGLFAVACADTFEERYDLAVNTDRYSVTAEAGKLPVTVYCSGAWTAQLTAESAWATLDRTAGSGITTIRLNYADNPGLARSVGVVLRGSGPEKTVTVVQKAGITAPELIFLSKDLAFANGAYEGTAAFETNLPDELLRDVVPAVTYAAEGDAWISDVAYQRRRRGGGRDRNSADPPGLITFATAANATGELSARRRSASRSTDADGNVFGDSFTVTQSADEARITLADDVAPIEGGRRAVAFSTNLGALLAEMKVEVTYADPAVADFISDVELGAGELTYAITANEGVEKRYATITVSCADLAGGGFGLFEHHAAGDGASRAKCRPPICGRLHGRGPKPYASDERPYRLPAVPRHRRRREPEHGSEPQYGSQQHHHRRERLYELRAEPGRPLRLPPEVRRPGRQRLPARGAGEDSARRRDPFARKRPDALHAARPEGREHRKGGRSLRPGAQGADHRDAHRRRHLHLLRAFGAGVLRQGGQPTPMSASTTPSVIPAMRTSRSPAAHRPRRPRTARPICSTTGTTTRSTCS
ncbi:MAG: BACON domain-containing protein [Alistipes shahii]